mgnify:CR=1 FL=1
MVYKPSEYPRVGPGRYYYIMYENLERTRAGNKVWKPRVKRVYISGKLLRWQKGRVRKRTGETVNGIKLVYENTRKGFKAQRGNTRYSVSRAEMEVAKVVELPKGARNIRLTTSKREAQPTIMEVR